MTDVGPIHVHDVAVVPEREKVKRGPGSRTVYGRKIYHVKTQQLSSGLKRTVDDPKAKDNKANEPNELERPA